MCLALGATTLWTLRRDSTSSAAPQNHWTTAAAATATANRGAKVASMAPLNPYGLNQVHHHQQQQAYGRRMSLYGEATAADVVGTAVAGSGAGGSQATGKQYQQRRLDQALGSPMLWKRAK